MITDSLINQIVSDLNTEITHLGVGTGIPPDGSSVLLDQEQTRKVCTKIIDSNTIICEVYWDETEGNGATYTNAGIFGNGATSTINTGQLFAGDSIDIAKNNTQSMTVSIEITVEAV